ncbi:MAG: DUF4349 domain-containing protein [Candidatus Dormibacteria bacterium]
MPVRSIAAALFATAALAGCASASTGSGSAGSQAGPAVARGASYAGRAPLAQANAPANAPATSIVVGTPPSSAIERAVTAAYTVPPGSFLASFQGVTARAVGLGGYVVSSTTQPDSGGRIVSGSVTLKVPAAKIADFLNGMPSTFTASSINFSAIDHTAQFVDVNARLASAHAHLAALDGLLAKATSITDIAQLEQQIEAVQTEVDTDQGELNVLTASVDLATATVRMVERGSSVAPAPPANPVSGGIGGGWSNAVRVTGAALDGMLSALPLLVVVAIGLLVWRRQARRALWRRPRRAAE